MSKYRITGVAKAIYSHIREEIWIKVEADTMKHIEYSVRSCVRVRVEDVVKDKTRIEMCLQVTEQMRGRTNKGNTYLIL